MQGEQWARHILLVPLLYQVMMLVLWRSPDCRCRRSLRRMWSTRRCCYQRCPWRRCSRPGTGLDTLRSESPWCSDMFPREQSCHQSPSICSYYIIARYVQFTLPFSPGNSLDWRQGSYSSKRAAKLQLLMTSWWSLE